MSKGGHTRTHRRFAAKGDSGKVVGAFATEGGNLKEQCVHYKGTTKCRSHRLGLG